ncbi:CLUMA_CG015446, isoform A [Clunio marinus]|uniref:CLUMA_CG015446, isoform A n=1 Tax=Clunio marinus TaxID=568069 RepID=A0A1J1IPM7_9DIPT|nr:CLUMA_CG015446, isoform A [Clunio marinus]
MDLDTLDNEAMEQEIHVNITSDDNILIHIPNESQEMLTNDIKEEHLDHIQTIYSLGNTQEENEDVDELHEGLEITKLKSSKKRVSLTIEKKIEIIQRHEKGETQRALSQEFNVGRTTISDILKRKYKFFKFMSMNADKEENLKRRRTLRRTVHKELEDKVLEWYNECRAEGGYISGPMIAAKAQELHKELAYTDNFTASNGWLDRFKVRNGIKLCGLREVKTESDINAVAPFKAEVESIAQWYNLSLEQIYNADESDLFWKMLPNPDSDVNEVKASVRAYRERMTILCCSNATGTHKLPLACIGRGKKSRTFTSHEIKTLPVNYYSQETAWMDQDIFREWFHSQFVPNVRQYLRSVGLNETALLLIDRSPSHPSDQFLRSDDGFFFCQYFPAKVKTLIQPMEQGILSSTKRHYRKELLNELIKQGTPISEFQKGLTLKDAIRGIARGWDSVSEEVIRKCFSKIFPATMENLQFVCNDNEDSIVTSAFEKLISQIVECYNYPTERLEKWLNCDEAEPQKYNSFKPALNETLEHIDMQEENLVFIDEQQEDVPDTIQIIGSVSIPQDNNQTILEQDTDEDLIEEEQEMLNTEEIKIQQSHESNFSQEENNGGVTCKQALDALQTLLKFMKSDSESRYKDVMMLQELKQKLKNRIIGSSQSSCKSEMEYS